MLVAFACTVHCEEEKKEEKKEEKDKKESVGTVVGIDLGTTYSWCVTIIFNLLRLKKILTNYI